MAEHQESWAIRHFESDDPHIWHRNNSVALGRVSMCRDIILMFEQLGEEERQQKEAKERFSHEE